MLGFVSELKCCECKLKLCSRSRSPVRCRAAPHFRRLIRFGFASLVAIYLYICITESHFETIFGRCSAVSVARDCCMQCFSMRKHGFRCLYFEIQPVGDRINDTKSTKLEQTKTTTVTTTTRTTTTTTTSSSTATTDYTIVERWMPNKSSMECAFYANTKYTNTNVYTSIYWSSWMMRIICESVFFSKHLKRSNWQLISYSAAQTNTLTIILNQRHWFVFNADAHTNETMAVRCERAFTQPVPCSSAHTRRKIAKSLKATRRGQSLFFLIERWFIEGQVRLIVAF